MTQPFDYKKTTKQFRKQVDAQVAGYIALHPELTTAQLARLFNCSSSTISTIAKEFGCHRPKGKGEIATRYKLVQVPMGESVAAFEDALEEERKQFEASDE